MSTPMRGPRTRRHRSTVTVVLVTLVVTTGSMLAAGCVPATPHAKPVNHPFGALDQARASGATVTFAGWADDKDSTAPIDVRVSLGRRRAVVRADKTRADVDARHRRGPRKGFAGSFTKVGDGAHQLCVVAINRGSGADRALGCRTVVVETNRGGYALLHDWHAAPSMGIYLHTSASAMGHLMPSAVAELAKATGNPYTYEGLTSSYDPLPGQIIVQGSDSSGCQGDRWAGCAESTPRRYADDAYVIERSLITIRRAYVTHPGSRGLLLHELGHTAGLGHFDGPYLGSLQVMNGRMNTQSRYQRGDLNGLAHTGARGREVVAETPNENAVIPSESTISIAD